jgi:hypothetical protein
MSFSGRALLAASVAFVLVVAITVSTLLAPSAGAFPGALSPNEGAYFGSRVEGRGGESPREALRRVESQIGRKFDIDHLYYSWNAHIPTSHQRWDVETGRIPFVNWLAGDDWDDIASGSEDGWIQDRADAFAEFGAPIYLSFHHEPEDDLSSFGSPGDYAAAFRRIVTIFRNRGASNVAFVWTMMAWSFDPRSGRDPFAYYPGGDYVDFIGGDGYNWYPGRPGDPWNSFQTVFEEINAWAQAQGKPWIAAEYGVQEDPGTPGRKGQWFRDAVATARAWPSLKAVIYFDVDKRFNWVTDTSPSSMEGYAAMANDPWFQQREGSGLPPPPSPTPPPPQPPPGGAPKIVKNALNTGPEGATIRARGSRGSTPFDAVVTTRDATLTYDSLHARGAFAAKHVLNDRSDAYYAWTGRRSVWFGRLFVWLPVHPAGDMRLVRASSDDDARASVNIRANGHLGFQDRENRWIVEGDVRIPVQRWVRIEWKVDHRTDRITIKLFSKPNSLRPREVIKAGPGLDIGSSSDLVQFGRSGSNAFSFTFWTDSPALSSKGFLGPGRR